jgi:hypothetical protein
MRTKAASDRKAKGLAQQYADNHLKGFTVERVLPFTGRRGTMYSVELKGPRRTGADIPRDAVG